MHPSVPETKLCADTQNKDKLQHKALPSWANMGNIFGHQKKNPLQPNTHPSGTQPTLPWRNALAVCSTWRRGWVRGGGGATNRARRRRQCHKNLQKLKRKLFPNRELKLVPKIGTTTRTLVHCYLKTNYAREGHQNMSPKLEPFSVPKTGTHYNPMRNRVRPKRYPSLIPSLQPHAQPSETQTTQMQVPKTVICC